MPENVTIVGAGPAGLAVAACLKLRGIEAVVLEQAAQVGPAWRNHYERLHLHTHKGGSGLPGLPFPAEYPRYPPRAQVVEYLEAYAKHHGLKPSFEEPVKQIVRDGEAWAITTSKRQLSSKQVVIATGYTRVPNLPTWPGLDGFTGEVLHSSRYKNGSPWKGKRVLVVGFGNSGGEIAIDLHEHGALPALSVRGQVNVIPRELLGLPILGVSALLRPLPARLADLMSAPMLYAAIGDITKLGLKKKPYGPMEQIKRDGRIPLIDVGTLALVREGKLKIHGGIERFEASAVTFEGGVTEPFDAVVLATGYRPKLADFLPAAESFCDAQGFPRLSDPLPPGLHLCGFDLSTRGMLREIGIEAQKVADKVSAS